MKKYAIHLPEGFGKIATAAYRALGANHIYAIGSQIFLTDEADDVEHPTDVFESLEAMESWLVQCAIDWLSDRAIDSIMADELENCL